MFERKSYKDLKWERNYLVSRKKYNFQKDGYQKKYCETINKKSHEKSENEIFILEFKIKVNLVRHY